MKRGRIMFILFTLGVGILSCENQNNVDPRYTDFFLKYHGQAGSQEAAQLMVTPDDGFVIVGTNYGDGDSEILVIKTDELGNEQWQVFIGREWDDYGTTIQIMDDGSGYLVAGNSTNALGNTDVLFVQIDNSGQEVNRVVLGNEGFSETVNDIIQLNQPDNYGGSYMIVGSTTNTEAFTGIKEATGLTDDYDFFFPKINQDFTVTSGWTTVYWGFEGSDRAISGYQNNDSEFLLAGTSNNPELGSGKEKGNFFIRGINEFGLENDGGGAFGTTDDQVLSEMSLTSDGGQVLVGTSSNGSNTSIYVARLSNSNKGIGEFELLEEENTTGKAIIEAQGGGYIILGTIERNANKDIYLFKIDARGARVWEKIYGGSSTDDTPGDIIQLIDGSLVFTATITLDNQTKIGLFKTNSKGELQP